MRLMPVLATALLCLAVAASAAAVNVRDTRLLQQPAVSQSNIAFVYDRDLWVAALDGSDVKRLTTHKGTEFLPHFSPDGQTIAFSAQYDGNIDAYLVPVEGGVPTRLTWHPGADIVQGFTPDGSSVLFRSGRAVHTGRHNQLFTVSLHGTFPVRLPIPHASKATYSPDGEAIAYTPLNEQFNQWKNYRGGTTSRIWLFDNDDYSVVEIPQPDGRCNDTDPIWLADGVYFLSDRDGEFNLYSYDPSSNKVRRLTSHEDFPIVHATGGGGKIIYEQAGYLHLFDPAAGTSSKVTVGVPADLIESRPRFVEGAEYIRNAAISPSGARAVFEFRGEIITVPAEKGDNRNLTGTTGAHERSPAWSPDGKSIAYFSDASGEYELHVAPQNGKGDVRTYALDGAGFYDLPRWSPDGKKISYVDNSWSLYYIDLERGKTKKIASEPLYGPVRTLHHAWSPDSMWLAYTLNTETYFQRVYLYSIEEKRSHAITAGLSDVSEPVFDADGDYLYFIASTDAGPVRQWFAMSNVDMESTGSIYLAVLDNEVTSPLAKQSDEEEGKDEETEADEEESDKDDGEDGDDQEPQVKIDFEGLSERIVALPLPVASYSNLQAGKAGQIYFMKSDRGQGLFGQTGKTSLRRYDLEEREEKTLLDDVDRYIVSEDQEKILIGADESWSIADAGDEIEAGKGKIAADKIQVKIEPRAEWAQIFGEAWRINRDYFYDPGMHGADWSAMRDKYAIFLPDLATRSDLNTVMRWMSSELAVGHHFLFGGDTLADPDSVPGGLLGADYEIDNGRYRLAKIYGGLNWNPELRSPLTEPGVNAEVGEYLLAVEGKELRAPENLYGRFENSADKIIEITLGPNPDGNDSRTVQVSPVRSESALRNRDWVEGNLKKVDEATDGRVAYVYVPNTTSLGHTYFKRYFFPQSDREAIIVDERHNSGGQVADYYIDILRRPFISYWAMRYGKDLKTPLGAIQGPKVMLIDETAGSGGDLFPWMFSKLGLGKLIGKQTWGGLVGILGFPILLDGGFITAPNLAIWTEDGWVVENVGVPPDIEVEQLPAEVIAGRDPQLEKAIEVILQELKANPQQTPKRPPYPVRVRR